RFSVRRHGRTCSGHPRLRCVKTWMPATSAGMTTEANAMLDLLQGIRVVSFNHFLLGPMGIQALADLGADVIAVETTEGAFQRHWSSGDIWHDGQSMVHLCTNRN